MRAKAVCVFFLGSFELLLVAISLLFFEVRNSYSHENFYSLTNNIQTSETLNPFAQFGSHVRLEDDSLKLQACHFGGRSCQRCAVED